MENVLKYMYFIYILYTPLTMNFKENVNFGLSTMEL